MTNNEIIRAACANLPADTLRAIVAATHTPETVAQYAAAIRYDDPADDTPENREADALQILAAASVHTFGEWKRRGYSVKYGEKAALRASLWMWTDKPNKAQRAAAEARKAAGETDADPDHADPHYYKKLCHLFSVLQVEKPAPVRVKTAEELAAENKKRIAAFNAARRAERAAEAAKQAPAQTPEQLTMF